MKTEQLTIQELAAYLPWEVECHAMGEVVEGTEYDENPVPKVFTINGTFLDSHNDRFVIIENEMENSECLLEECFMLLYPSSHLTKEIEHKGEKFTPYDYFYNDPENDWFEGNVWMNYIFEGNMDKSDINFIPFYVTQKLLEWHFDIFGLIDRGLAIDKTTV